MVVGPGGEFWISWEVLKVRKIQTSTMPMFITDDTIFSVENFSFTEKYCGASTLAYIISDIFIQKFSNSCTHMIPGADPRMVRIGTGPPFWQINHANSAYFRLFLGYFGVISATRPPLFTYSGSSPVILHPKDSFQTWHPHLIIYK